jgi:hypothetical protein
MTILLRLSPTRTSRNPKDKMPALAPAAAASGAAGQGSSIRWKKLALFVKFFGLEILAK